MEPTCTANTRKVCTTFCITIVMGRDAWRIDTICSAVFGTVRFVKLPSFCRVYPVDISNLRIMVNIL